MAKKKPKKLSKKELKYKTRMELQNPIVDTSNTVEANQVDKKTIAIPKVVPVRHLAQLAGIPTTAVITALFKNGVMATINESIDMDTAVLIGEDLGLNLVFQDEEKNENIADTKDTIVRPPVVTIMGHVDHGKTKLLDSIKQTNVMATESGGITQHIGAYQIETKYEGQKRKITFLDTPGHEAFSALRAHGANLTDIVVLVVAADDGVKAQTIEAISHARAAQVPIIVTINKIDLPAADPDRVKRDLAQHNLLAEDWGGKTPFVSVSAKDGTNINQLLDIILLVSDILEPKSSIKGVPQGTVIESHVDVGVGTLATVLVQQGILKVGQIIVAGQTWGKIRFMEDWRGNRVVEAYPSTPIRVSGIKGVPAFGDQFNVVADEKTARETLENTDRPAIVRSVNSSVSENEFRIIIRADVVGSLQAIKAALADIPQDKVSIKILSEGIGSILESDVNLAFTSDAFIFGFNVTVPKVVAALADREKVTIKIFDTIYKLTDELYRTIEGQISPSVDEEIVGRLNILKVFFQTAQEAIVGGKVIEGNLSGQTKIRIIRDEKIVMEGKITNVKIGPSTVPSVAKNEECGLEIFKKEGSIFKIKEGDIVEAYVITKKVTTLSDTSK
jgi:translation initiation factor IF-2